MIRRVVAAASIVQVASVMMMIASAMRLSIAFAPVGVGWAMFVCGSVGLGVNWRFGGGCHRWVGLRSPSRLLARLLRADGFGFWPGGVQQQVCCGLEAHEYFGSLS